MLVPVLTALFCLFTALSARADTRVTVNDFFGPNADKVREDVVESLETQEGLTLISKEELSAAAEKLKVDPDSPEGRAALSRELQVSAWMTGMVQKRGKKLKLTLAVYDGAQHSLVGRTRLTGTSMSRLSSAIKNKLWKRSRVAIMRASTQAATDQPEPETTTESAAQAEDTALAEAPARSAPEDESEEDGGDEPTAPKRESVRAFLGFGTPYRDLAYTSRFTQSLGDYRMAGAPMLALDVAYHPAAAFTEGWLSWIALEVGAQFSLSTPTSDTSGNKFSSRYDAYHFGVRARMPVSEHHFSAFTGYAMNRLAISAEDGDVDSATPNIDYRMIRTGLGAEIGFSDTFMAGAELAWLHLLGVGDIGNWFPRASAAGLELGASATYAITSGIFARVNASYQRMFFDFNSEPGDRYVAGGATDQHLAISVGAGLKL